MADARSQCFNVRLQGQKSQQACLMHIGPAAGWLIALVLDHARADRRVFVLTGAAGEACSRTAAGADSHAGSQQVPGVPAAWTPHTCQGGAGGHWTPTSVQAAAANNIVGLISRQIPCQLLSRWHPFQCLYWIGCQQCITLCCLWLAHLRSAAPAECLL